MRISPRSRRGSTSAAPSAAARTSTSSSAADWRPDAMVSLTANDASLDGIPPADIEAVCAHGTGLRRSRASGADRRRLNLGERPDGVRRAGAIQGEWQDVDLASMVRDALHGDRPRPAVGAAQRHDRCAVDSAAVRAVAADGRRAGRDGVAGSPRRFPSMGRTFALHSQPWQLSTDDIGTAGARVSSVRGTVDPRELAPSSIGGSVHVGTGDVGRLVDALARAGVIATAANVSGKAAGDFTVSGSVDASSLDGPLRAQIGYESLPTRRCGRTRPSAAHAGAGDRPPARRLVCAGRAGVVAGHRTCCAACSTRRWRSAIWAACRPRSRTAAARRPPRRVGVALRNARARTGDHHRQQRRPRRRGPARRSGGGRGERGSETLALRHRSADALQRRRPAGRARATSISRARRTRHI